MGTLGGNSYDFVQAEKDGEWDVEWNQIPDSSFRSPGVLTSINKWLKFACTPEAIKVGLQKYIGYSHKKNY